MEEFRYTFRKCCGGPEIQEGAVCCPFCLEENNEPEWMVVQDDICTCPGCGRSMPQAELLQLLSVALVRCHHEYKEMENAEDERAELYALVREFKGKADPIVAKEEMRAVERRFEWMKKDTYTPDIDQTKNNCTTSINAGV